MKKILVILLGAFCWGSVLGALASEKFDVLPDLPEPLAAAQASSVTNNDIALPVASQSIGQEPNFLSLIFSLFFVILLIYATGIIYAKLNKFGAKTLKKQMSDIADSKVAVLSSTPLGSNKSLHVVELDGKRMLIGASNGSIQLIKDLGTYPPSSDDDDTKYSKIEIPNIRIPKIEIPKIEFPNIGFTRITNDNKKSEGNEDDVKTESDSVEINDICDENPDGIIDKLFENDNIHEEQMQTVPEHNVHKVDPEEYALYKKYL